MNTLERLYNILHGQPRSVLH